MQTAKFLKFVSLALVIVLLSALFVSGTQAQSTCPWTHRVRFGDRLAQIASFYGTSVSELMRINPQVRNANLIITGTTLCISETAMPPALPVGTAYDVVRGDTLSFIAFRFGTTVRAIADASGITNPDFILAGETITIP